MSEKLEHKSSLTSSILWSILGAAGQQVAALAIFVLLARMLGPPDFGLLALAAVFVDVFATLAKFGVTEIVIRHTQLQDRRLSTAFWLSALVGLTFSCLIILLSHPLEILFATEGLAKILRYISIVAFISAISSVHEGMLRREFQYKAIAVRGFFANVVSGVVAVILALSGFGIISLVVQRILSTFLSLMVMISYCRWKPKLQFSFEEAVAISREGFPFAMANLLAMGNQKVVDLFVGYSLGVTSLGYLRIAWRTLDMLLELIIRPITQVSLSMFSRLDRCRDRLGAAYSSLTELTSILAFPCFIGIGLIGTEFVDLVFGDEWSRSAEVMQISSLMVFALPTIYFKSNALFAVGKSMLVLYLNIFEFVISSLIILISVRFGLEGVAIGNVARFYVVMPVIILFLSRYIQIDFAAIFRSLVPALHGVFWMCLLSVLISNLGQTNYVLMMVVKMAICALSYVAVLLVFHRPFLLKLFGEFRQGGASKVLNV